MNKLFVCLNEDWYLVDYQTYFHQQICNINSYKNYSVLMKSYMFVHTSDFTFNIDIHAPKLLKLSSIEYFKLVNPYLHSQAYKDANLLPRVGQVVNESCFLTTKGLIFECSIENDSNAKKTIWEWLPIFFRQLRFLSRQVTILPYSVAMIGTIRKISSKKLEMEAISSMHVNSDYYRTMVTWKHLREADKIIFRNKQIPVHEEIFLEAYLAVKQSQFNKAILFSTIAIESLLAHSYDRIYEQEKTRKKSKRSLRFITDGHGNVKDPVWEVLRNGKSDFKKLLHELPLYLINRSIKIENEPLYTKLTHLYSTRNQIVHLGAPAVHKPESLIPLDESGARASLEMADAVFRWMGNTSYSSVLETKFIPLGNPQISIPDKFEDKV